MLHKSESRHVALGSLGGVIINFFWRIERILKRSPHDAATGATRDYGTGK